MRIDRLTVQNFRCFDSRTFDLTPQFNVFIGTNASGKTAVLEALAIAAGSWLLGLKGPTSQPIRLNDVRLVGHNSGDETTFEAQYPVKICAEGRVNEQKLAWARSLNGPGGRTTHTDTAEIKHLAAQADIQVRNGTSIVLPVVAYYGTARLWHTPNNSEVRREYSKRELSRFVGYRDSTHPRINARELTSWMERQDRIAYQEKREPLLLRVVRQAMQQMLPDAADVRFNSRRLEIVVEFNNGVIQPFSHLSDGQRSLAGFAGDLAMRMSRLNPHLGDSVLQQTPGIVLIDEIDLHLHPNWQRHIVEDMRRLFPKVQFVATTHSPFIVQTLREGELLMLEGQPVPQLGNLGLEDIAEGLMGVPNAEVSPRYHEMVNSATRYLLTLEEAAKSPEEKLAAYKTRLAENIAPYADNPAFQAFLELKRAVKLKE